MDNIITTPSKLSSDDIRTNFCMNCWKVNSCDIQPNDLLIQNHMILENNPDGTQAYTCDEFKLAGVTFLEENFNDQMKELATKYNIEFGKRYKITDIVNFLFALDSLRMECAIKDKKVFLTDPSSANKN